MADIRIKDLPSTNLPNLLHEFPAEKDDLTVKLKLQQILDLVTANLLNADPTFAQTVLTALAKRLRFDAAQTLTLSEQNQAMANIGAINAIPDHVRDLIMSNNASDANNRIDITTGQAKGNSKSVVNSATMTKRLDAAWAAGTGNGGLDTGAKANSTTYHGHAIVNNTTGAFDALFSTSVSAPTVSSGWTRVQRLGSIITDGSGNIRPFIQDRNDFYWNTVAGSLPSDLSTTAARAKALLTCNLPTGIRVLGYFQSLIEAAAGDTETILTVADGANTNIEKSVRIYVSTGTKRAGQSFDQYTNTSAQIYAALSLSSSTLSPSTIKTLGWRDYQIPRI
ncbi:hypothetical protein [Rhizobium sp. F40D2]|uniref:hypothetical protein n=1 Tax=Rhizobium sp. F40D2 TaxID=3453141 RepID=UPI003F2545B3